MVADLIIIIERRVFLLLLWLLSVVAEARLGAPTRQTFQTNIKKYYEMLLFTMLKSQQVEMGG